MQNSTSKYMCDRKVLRIRRIPLKSSIVFFTGVITMVHLMVLFSYVMYAVVIAILLAGCILIEARKGFRLNRNIALYLSWYGLLYLLILFSFVYTVNKINPDYVLKRCSVIFVLGYITSVLVNEEKDFITLANGLIVGALACIFVSFVNESARVGIGRLGDKTLGSAVALSSAILVGFVCAAWRCIYKEKYRILFGILSIVMMVVIALTGSRRPILIAIMMTLLLVLFNRNIKKSRRFLFFFITLLIMCVFAYIILTNEVLYKIIGWRIESMITTLLRLKNTVQDASMLERSIMKEYGYELFSQRPLLGYGVHGFAYMFYRYYGLLVYSHCGFSELLACYGIIGFLIYYRIFFVYAKKSIRVLKKGTDVQVLMVLYALLTFISETYTMAFISPHTTIMMVAGINMLKGSIK